jgi:hypothetical protein
MVLVGGDLGVRDGGGGWTEPTTKLWQDEIRSTLDLEEEEGERDRASCRECVQVQHPVGNEGENLNLGLVT